MYDEPMKTCNSIAFIDTDRRRTVSERIHNNILELEKRLAELRAADEALKANPAIAGVIDTLSRLGI